MVSKRFTREGVVAIVFVASGLAAEARASDARMLRLHPCDGAAAFAKEFRLPRGTVITGLKLTTESGNARFPEIALLSGRLSESSGVVLRHIENAPCDAGLVSATWEGFVTTEDVYHVIVRMPAESAGAQAPRVGAAEVEVPVGTFVVGENDEVLMAVNADLDLHLVTRTAKASSAAGEPVEDRKPAIESLAVQVSGAPVRATVVLAMRSEASVEVAVHDVRGQLVRTITKSFLASGKHEFTWDGSIASGALAARGVYFVTARAEGRQLARRAMVW